MRVIFFSLACIATLGSIRAFAQDLALLDYVDPTTKKLEKLRGAGIRVEKDSPEGLTVSYRGREILVPPAAIRNVRYQNNAKLNYLTDISKPYSLADRAPSLAKGKPKEVALQAYQDAATAMDELLKKAESAPAVYRHTLYRIGDLYYEMGKLDASYNAKAISAWTLLRDKHFDGWQITPAITKLAQILEVENKIAEAAETYKFLAQRVAGVPPEMKRNALFTAVGLYLRNDKTAEAKLLLGVLDNDLPKNDPQAPRVKIYLAQCTLAGGKPEDAKPEIANVQEIARTSKDPVTLALAHNTLGDYHRKLNNGEEAFWSYLRVHVQFGSDRVEHAKALYYLSDLFASVKNDPSRAAACLEQLKNKEFEGTSHHQLALKKKP